MLEKIIKTVLAVLFFICVADLPYGFYQLVRFVALVGFVYLSYHSFECKNNSTAYIYAVLALLFQPIFKISLGREIWIILDIAVGIGLLISIFIKSEKYPKH